MINIWNPWHGCIKISEGCQNCYMYYLDEKKNKNGREIYKSKTNFNMPIQKDRQGNYKIKSGEYIRVCMTSDFFLEEADIWRKEAWDIIRKRKDVLFILLTKRIDRVEKCLPDGWNNGWDNVYLEVTAENQKRADERIPILLKLPFKYKGITVAPILEEVNLDKYLKTNLIDSVSVAGENYTNARVCNFSWIKSLQQQCIKYDVNFEFFETGMNFVKDNKKYYVPKNIQQQQAKKANLNYKGKNIEIKLAESSSDYEQINMFD